jgi:Recombinase
LVGAASEINRPIKEIRAVALAASDMRQAAAAAEALANEHQNVHVMRALETAVVVCYWRPFASGNAVRLDPAEWTPRDAQEVAAHETLKALRDKVYAHTDSVIKIGGEKVRARDVERIRGQRLIRVGELERFLREHLEAPRPAAAPHPAGRLPSLPEAVVDRVRLENAHGRSLGEIARGLTAEGVPTAHGGRRWWPSTVRAVLLRASG